MLSHSQNEVAQLINHCIENGRLRDCTHLAIYFERHSYTKPFNIICKQQSFDYRENEPLPICPRNCIFFASRQIALATESYLEREKFRAGVLRSIGGLIKTVTLGPFKWFGKLPWQTQFAIILLTILFFAPRWIQPILQVLHLLKN